MKICKCEIPTLDRSNKYCEVCGMLLQVEDLNYNPFPWIPDGKLLKVTRATNDK